VIPGLGAVILYYKRIVRKIPLKLRRQIPCLQQDYVVMRHWEWAQGLHRVGKNQIYVNRGLGTYLPRRLFCPPEVTIITLQNE
jgi:predicted MPP superfamily phosphohydrolase